MSKNFKLIEEANIIEKLPILLQDPIFAKIQEFLSKRINQFSEIKLEVFKKLFKSLKLTGFAESDIIYQKNQKIKGF